MNTHFELSQDLEVLFRKIPACRNMHHAEIAIKVIENLDFALNSISVDCALFAEEAAIFRSKYISEENYELNLRQLIDKIGLDCVERMVKEFQSIVEQYETDKEFFDNEEN